MVIQTLILAMELQLRKKFCGNLDYLDAIGKGNLDAIGRGNLDAIGRGNLDYLDAMTFLA